MTRFARSLVVLIFAALVIAGTHVPVDAEQASFSLAIGQAVTLGQYTLVFRGVSGQLPVYDLFWGSSLLARLPTTTSPPNPAEYGYGNGTIGIATKSVAPDGLSASGTLTVR